MSFHHCSHNPLVAAAALVLLTACSNSEQQSSVNVDTTMDSLVTAEWLNQHIDDPNLVVLDCTVHIEQDEKGGFRMESGRANYLEGHIPNAGFADLLGELSDSDSPFDFAMPKPEAFAAAMSALGVADDSRVVLYDTDNSGWAARVWWMLRWIGFDDAALLDGGLGAWTAGDRVLSTDLPSRATGNLTVALRPEVIADRDEVLASIGNDAVNIIDALPDSHYRGDWAMYERPGHIAGASNVPTDLLHDEDGRYRPQDELDMLFDGDRNDRAITYCGGGIAASADAFALHRLGFKDVAIYAASLNEWAADPANPMETGSD